MVWVSLRFPGVGLPSLPPSVRVVVMVAMTKALPSGWGVAWVMLTSLLATANQVPSARSSSRIFRFSRSTWVKVSRPAGVPTILLLELRHRERVQLVLVHWASRTPWYVLTAVVMAALSVVADCGAAVAVDKLQA